MTKTQELLRLQARCLALETRKGSRRPMVHEIHAYTSRPCGYHGPYVSMMHRKVFPRHGRETQPELASFIDNIWVGLK